MHHAAIDWKVYKWQNHKPHRRCAVSMQQVTTLRSLIDFARKLKSCVSGTRHWNLLRLNRRLFRFAKVSSHWANTIDCRINNFMCFVWLPWIKKQPMKYDTRSKNGGQQWRNLYSPPALYSLHAIFALNCSVSSAAAPSLLSFVSCSRVFIPTRFSSPSPLLPPFFYFLLFRFIFVAAIFFLNWEFKVRARRPRMS